MTKLKTVFMASVIMASGLATQVHADEKSDLTILEMGCSTESNACFIKIDKAMTCGGASSIFLDFDATTPAGKNVYALASIAFSTGSKKVHAVSSPICRGPNPILANLSIVK